MYFVSTLIEDVLFLCPIKQRTFAKFDFICFHNSLKSVYQSYISVKMGITKHLNTDTVIFEYGYFNIERPINQ